jgi:prophage regulatory protein
MRFLKLQEVMHLTQLSRSSIYASMKDETFPHHIKIGKRSVGWTEESVQNWITNRIQGIN